MANLSFLLQIITTSRIPLLVLAIVGTTIRINSFLSRQALNNWTRDENWDWAREIVVITGGSSGIGASIAQNLVALNVRTKIVIIDRNRLLWEPPKGSRVHYLECDLSRKEQLQHVCQKIRREIGSPTVLINNAGLSNGLPLIDSTDSKVELTVKVNLLAPFLLIQEFLPDMVKRNHGHIVGISSLSAISPPARLADYAATKAGLIVMHESLRSELKHIHKAPKVRISTAILSFIKTPFFHGKIDKNAFLMPLLEVDTVGESIVDTLYSGHARNLFLPGFGRVINALRGGPEWLGISLQDSSQKLKIRWASSGPKE